MAGGITISARALSVAAFSFLFAYVLSFVFEGQVLYGLLATADCNCNLYVPVGIAAQLLGLLTSGLLFAKSQRSARTAMLVGITVAIVATLPFYFAPSVLWMIGLGLGGYASGVAVAAWGYFFKNLTPKPLHIKTCADILIYSNLLMIGINTIAANRSPLVGLSLSMLSLVAGLVLTWRLPSETTPEPAQTANIGSLGIARPLLLLAIFIVVITINSGLMYQVINPAFDHLSPLTSWYWAVPYVVGLMILRNLPSTASRHGIVYVGMGMLAAAFIAFMLLGDGAINYIVVDTLLLGSIAIFDLFWWSLLAAIMGLSKNPARTLGIGLSANVLGVLVGGLLGMAATSIGLPSAQVAVIALTVIGVSLAMLPALNRHLVGLLASHSYLSVYDAMSPAERRDVKLGASPSEPLTPREQEVLELILSGNSTREIAADLFVSENTVKTHTRHIYAKYQVSSRAQLISLLLGGQVPA